MADRNVKKRHMQRDRNSRALARLEHEGACRIDTVRLERLLRQGISRKIAESYLEHERRKQHERSNGKHTGTAEFRA